MPTWGELLQELGQLEADLVQRLGRPLQPGDPSVFDELRRGYLRKLSEKTGRATFIYYSGWNEKDGVDPRTITLSGNDIEGFMEACSNTTERELDLIIHSPGGDGDAVEQISGYLRTRFDHIRAIVPVTAMSAATMLALSTDEIVMASHSQLGPIDPQFTISTPEGPRSASAQAIKDQFELAREQCRNPEYVAAWLPMLRSLSPGLLSACDHAAERARTIVKDALRQYMFANDADAETKAESAAQWFGNATHFNSHSRPVRRDEARAHDIVVTDLEDDDDFQDLVLSVHHATVLTFSNTPAVKIVENDRGRAWMKMVPTPPAMIPLQIQGPPVPQFPVPGPPPPGTTPPGPPGP